MIFFRAKERSYKGLEFIHAITGVGLLSTIHRLLLELNQHKPDLVIQPGIAGTFHDENWIGTATVVKTESQPEMGVWEDNLYRDVFEMGLMQENTFPYQQKKLFNPHEHLISACKAREVNAISVNRITTSESDIALYKNKYMADIESMEGAAMHYLCIFHAVPFVQIRGISNLVGDRNKSNWKIKVSMDAAAESCHQLFSSLNTLS